MTRKVDIVLVHYGDPEPTRAALARLRELPLASVTVVDNSGDLQAVDGVVRPGRNIGFGAGVNLGASCGKARWILVLNPDAELHAEGFAALLTAGERSPRHAVLAPRLVDADGAPQVNGGAWSGWVRELARVSGVGARLRALRSRCRRDGHAVALIERDWVSGAAMLVRRSAFEAVGGFDERFFLYYEDEDLCRRLRARGWLIAVHPGAAARHAVGGSQQTADPYRTPHFERSRRLYHQLHSDAALRSLVARHSRRLETRWS